MRDDKAEVHRASLYEKYRDVLGDDTATADPDLLSLVSSLAKLSTESEPPAFVVQSIGRALDVHISTSLVQSPASHKQFVPSISSSLLACTTQWVGRRLRGMPKAVVFLLAVFILVGATYSVMSVIDQAFYLDESTRRIAENKIGLELNQSKTIDGFTVSVKRVYADEDQIVIGYTISGPQERKFDTFMASGALNDTPDSRADILPTLTDAPGNKLDIIGVAAAFDTGAQGGEYGQALRYAMPVIAEDVKEISLHFEVGKITAYEQVSEGNVQAITVTGPFEFGFVVPIEACCPKTQPN